MPTKRTGLRPGAMFLERFVKSTLTCRALAFYLKHRGNKLPLAVTLVLEETIIQETKNAAQYKLQFDAVYPNWDRRLLELTQDADFERRHSRQTQLLLDEAKGWRQ